MSQGKLGTVTEDFKYTTCKSFIEDQIQKLNKCIH